MPGILGAKEGAVMSSAVALLSSATLPRKSDNAEGGVVNMQDVMSSIRPEGRKEIEKQRPRDVLYLFTLHLEWRDRKNICAYDQLIAALDDPDDAIRMVAKQLLQRASPRPRHLRCSGDQHGEAA